MKSDSCLAKYRTVFLYHFLPSTHDRFEIYINVLLESYFKDVLSERLICELIFSSTDSLT